MQLGGRALTVASSALSAIAPAGNKPFPRVTSIDSVPAGVYEHLITHALDQRLATFVAGQLQKAPLDPADADEVLVRHIASLTRRALRQVRGTDATKLASQVQLVNRLTRSIADLAPGAAGDGDAVALSHELLLAVRAANASTGAATFPVRPATPLSASALLVNGRGQPQIGAELIKELATADRVDLLCAFVKWHGVRVLDQALAAFVARGGRLRVITTTYIGATDKRALDRLIDLGAEVKVSYETSKTRLHAKAWLFRRITGLDTAYVGSSNLSKTAILDGLEWNVRLSSGEQSHLIDTFAATFDQYWANSDFEPYDPQTDGDRFSEAIARERGGPTELPLTITALEVRPFGFQTEVLDELDAERKVHDRWRNLVVMATGTGKTVVSALDYRRLVDERTVDSLLFVAHREEILTQSLSVFRQVLRRADFGELMVGGSRPTDWRHVFASVQSLSRQQLAALHPKQFDMVIVDEFHHAKAPSYERLLHRFQPKVLLGLTATPERSDGLDVKSYFDGRIASELRLWEALERGLLSPFQYFGCHDDTALDQIRWKRGSGYDIGELTNLYTGTDARVRLILQAVLDKIDDPGAMRAIGFCVGIEHAEFMAKRFTRAGIPSCAVTSASDPAVRTRALRDLGERRVNVLFTVDLFNEGVDLPTIDTVLFLRPTESATIFLQQLGRGLRLAPDKPCLTVLDFIGSQNAAFRFDRRYRAITGSSRRDLQRHVEEDFPTLPAGCHIALDRVAKDIVLRNIRSSLQLPWRNLAGELRALGDVTIEDFLSETGLELEDLYRGGRGGWANLRRDAGLLVQPATDDDSRLSRAIGRLLYIDDPLRLSLLRSVTTDGHSDVVSDVEARLARMLGTALYPEIAEATTAHGLARQLRKDPARRSELGTVADILWNRMHRVTSTVPVIEHIPICTHARYSRIEALTAFGVPNPETIREGVKWIEAERADLFFVTLQKTEAHFSPSTMYADRAISPELFQWESQSTTSSTSPTGQRYISHATSGSSVHLFIRDSKIADGHLGVPPFLYAGPMTYLEHSGSRPMRVIWRLDQPLPADVFHSSRVASD